MTEHNPNANPIMLPQPASSDAILLYSYSAQRRKNGAEGDLSPSVGTAKAGSHRVMMSGVVAHIE